MSILSHALKYLELGLSVIPVRGPVYSDNKDKSKSPLIRWHEYQITPPTKAVVSSWFGKWSNANIALVTGKVSGVVVVDLDSEEAVKWAEEQQYLNTVLVKTSRGLHAYYQYPYGRTIKNSVNAGMKIDVRGDGGYVIIPPSKHFEGHVYAWVQGREIGDYPLAVFPEYFTTNGTSVNVPTDLHKKPPLKELYGGIAVGGRNNAIARLCGSWVNNKLTYQECLDNALLINSKNRPPLDKKEVESIVKSIYYTHKTRQRKKQLIANKKDTTDGFTSVYSLFIKNLPFSLSQVRQKGWKMQKEYEWGTVIVTANELINPRDVDVFLTIKNMIDQAVRTDDIITNTDSISIAIDIYSLKKECKATSISFITDCIRRLATWTVSFHFRDTKIPHILHPIEEVAPVSHDENKFNIRMNKAFYEKCFSNGFGVNSKNLIALKRNIDKALYIYITTHKNSNGLSQSSIEKTIGLNYKKNENKREIIESLNTLKNLNFIGGYSVHTTDKDTIFKVSDKDVVISK